MNEDIVCYDVDDSLFFSNQLIGMEVDGTFTWLTQREFHEHDVNGTLNDTLDFSKLTCSVDFTSDLKPNMILINKLASDIAHEESKIIVCTARHEMNDLELFKSAFERYGIDTTPIEFIFAGGLGEAHWSSHQKKAIAFERMLGQKPNSLTVYDDNELNLREVLLLSFDFPFTTIITFLVNQDGTISRYHGTE